MKNKFKEKLGRGEAGIGTFYELGGHVAAEGLALSGMDFFIIDCEHGPYDVESAAVAILAAERHGATPFVRTKGASRLAILKMLDIGAMGLIVPFLESLEQAKELVRFAKYSPMGQRGFAFTRVDGFGYGPMEKEPIYDQMQVINRETLLIPQCETMGCLNQVEEIVALEGIDGLFVGPYDLSIALGVPGDFSSQKMQDALKRVQKACRNAGKISLIFAPNPERAKEFISMGYQAVAIGTDISLLVDGARSMLKAMRQ